MTFECIFFAFSLCFNVSEYIQLYISIYIHICYLKYSHSSRVYPCLLFYQSETAKAPIKSIGAVDKSLHGKANPLFIKRLSQRYFSSYSFMIVTQFQYLYANPHNTCR